MNLLQRKVLVHHLDPVAVALQHVDQRLVHARAVRALEVVIHHHRDLGVLVAPHRPALQVDLRHQLRLRIARQVHLLHRDQRLAVLAQQKLLLLRLFAIGQHHRQLVVARELLARLPLHYRHANIRRQIEGGKDLLFNAACNSGLAGLCALQPTANNTTQRNNRRITHSPTRTGLHCMNLYRNYLTRPPPGQTAAIARRN